MPATGKAVQCWLLTPTSQVPVAKPIKCRTPPKSQQGRDESGRPSRNVKRCSWKWRSDINHIWQETTKRCWHSDWGLQLKMWGWVKIFHFGFERNLKQRFWLNEPNDYFLNFFLLLENIVNHFFSMISIFTSCTRKEKLTKLTCNYLTTDQV